MGQNGEEVIRRGSFQKVAFSSAKKLTCGEGELTLTPNSLLINCKKFWSRSFPTIDIRLEARDGNLEIRDFWYGRLLFKLIVDDAEEWDKAFQKITNEYVLSWMKKLEDMRKKKPEELSELLEINPEILGKITVEIQKERLHFGEKNIDFILNIHRLVWPTENRKLKAFILAHCYVAFYEWTKNLLSKIYKGKFGSGPKDDEELIKFLEKFPSLKVLDTREWGINANQIRNCIAHEKFYYDYKRSELVFTIKKKHKRIRLRELEWRCLSMSHIYATLIQSLKQKVETGKIHYESYF